MKKLLSKFFRVATEGDTTDGRAITAQQIDQMARNYNPQKYAARVWMEHLRSLLPDSPFKAYGDVEAVKAETIDGKRVLLAQLSPTPDLVAFNQQRQKLFSSIEMAPNFANTGEAYLVGMAVTDTPASLGTEMLQFCAQQEQHPLANRKQEKANLFSAAAPAELEFEDAPADPDQQENFLAKIKAMLSGGQAKTTAEFGAAMSGVQQAVEAIATSQREQLEKFGALNIDELKQTNEQLSADLKKLREEYDATVKKLSGTPAPSGQRPAATGGDKVVTDC